MSTYRLYVNGEKTEHTVKGKSPAKALRELVEMSDYELVDQDGRYGHATLDGQSRSVMALTEPWGRVDKPDARTTRLRGYTP